MDSKQISPGELAKGQFVTCLTPITIEKDVVENESLGFGCKVTKIRNEDSSYMGRVLEVLAVCLPYVVVRVSPFSYSINLDTRKTIFMELSKEYVDAMLIK